MSRPATASPESAGPVQDRVSFTFAEHMILGSDRSSARLLVGLLAQTDGVIDTEALRTAAEAVVARRPELGVLPGHGPRTGGLTRPPGRPVVALDDVSSGGDDAWRLFGRLLSEPFDLTRGPGIRLLVTRRPEGDVVVLAAHHLLLDGRSALALLTEILAAVVLPAGRPDVAPAGPRRLAQATGANQDWAPSQAARNPLPYRAVRALRGRLVTRLDVPARRIMPSGTAGVVGYGVHPMTLPVPDPPATDGPRPTVNDLLLAACHLAVARWNDDQGRRTGVLQVRMPAAGPASAGRENADLGNRTGQSVIVSGPADRARPRELCGRVVAQTGWVKTGGASAAVGRSGAAAEALAGVLPARPLGVLLRAAVTAARFVVAPAAAVSNLGWVPEDLTVGVGGPRVGAIAFAATAGPPQGLLIGVTRTGATLLLTFCHHLAVLDRAGAEAFARVFRTAFDEVSGAR